MSPKGLGYVHVKRHVSLFTQALWNDQKTQSVRKAEANEIFLQNEACDALLSVLYKLLNKEVM